MLYVTSQIKHATSIVSIQIGIQGILYNIELDASSGSKM